MEASYLNSLAKERRKSKIALVNPIVILYCAIVMKKAYRDALIARINRKDWWHVPPSDPRAYDKRGKFYASTFREGEFWGRPGDVPERVMIHKPVIGDEPYVYRALFGKPVKLLSVEHPGILEWRWKLDARMKRAALAKGFDAIVILSPSGFKKLRTQGKLPRSIELNVLNPTGA
jgi:hypothetical protein